MSSLGKYLLTIVLTAFSCELLQKLIGLDSSVGKTVKMIARVVVFCAVLTPIIPRLNGDMLLYIPEYADAARDFVEAGKSFAQEEQSAIICSRCTSYIFDKAQALGAEIAIELEMAEDAPYAPQRICISGRVSPYAKGRLMQIIENDLGIPREDQIWTGS